MGEGTTKTKTAPSPANGAVAAEPPPQPGGVGRRAKELLSFRKIGGVYVLLIVVIGFSIWIPSFLTMDTLKQILNGNAVAAIAALALLLGLSAGVFDLSVASNMSLTGVVMADLIANHAYAFVPAVLVTLLVALGVGLLNGFVVVLMRIDSFIGTLATGSLIAAVITILTNGNTITGVNLVGSTFADVAQKSFLGGFTLPIIYALVIAIVIWIVQERTATGRRLYAIGFNPDAARLAGVHTNSLRFATLLVSAVLGGVAGIVLASSIGSGSPTAGDPYLLSGFSAAFLGATQLKEGRFNAWGTIIAIILLGTGIVGLGLAGAALWAQSLFTGVVLIAALAVTSYERRQVSLSFVRRRLRRGASAAGTGSEAPS